MNTPDFSDVELLLPEGWMQTKEDGAAWRAAIFKASLFRAFIDYYRKQMDKVSEALGPLLPEDQRMTDAQKDHHAMAIAALSWRYVQDQIGHALQHAAETVLQEALNRQAVFFVEHLGADDATMRAALPPRGAVEKKALTLLRRRLQAVPFRGKGAVAEWTSLSLTDAVLDAMAQIADLKNRTRWRVAATMFGEDAKTGKQRNALTSRLNKLLTDHGVDYAALERIDDQRREK